VRKERRVPSRAGERETERIDRDSTSIDRRRLRQPVVLNYTDSTDSTPEDGF
jgi:hypothetical protein